MACLHVNDNIWVTEVILRCQLQVFSFGNELDKVKCIQKTTDKFQIRPVYSLPYMPYPAISLTHLIVDCGL